MLQPDLANQVEVLPFIDMGVQLRSCGPFLLCVTKGTWRQDDTIKPQARRLGGVRTQPRAGLREKPPKRGRPRVGAPPIPPSPHGGAGRSVRALRRRLPPGPLRGGARSSLRAGTAVVWPASFPEFTQALRLAWQPGNLFQSRPPARPLRTRRCHRRSRGRRRSHDAPRQPSPQWAAMLSE